MPIALYRPASLLADPAVAPVRTTMEGAKNRMVSEKLLPRLFTCNSKQM